MLTSTSEDSSVVPHAPLNRARSLASVPEGATRRTLADQSMPSTTRRRLALGIGAPALDSDDESEDDVASLPPSASFSMDDHDFDEHEEEHSSGSPTR